MSVTTKDLMNAALKLAGLSEMPVDSEISIPGEGIKKVLVGVDMETAEVLLARELGVCCVCSHHPKTNNVNYADIMDHHIGAMVKQGVPINKAQRALKSRKDDVALNRHTANSDRFISAARLLNMPYLSIHTPADLISEKVVQAAVDAKIKADGKATLKDVMAAINEVPEYKNCEKKSVIKVGDEKSFAGKTVVCMAGGTNGGPDVLKAYFEAGVGTIIQMHCTKDDIKAVKDQNLGNLIMTPHMASDSIGMNVILKEWEKMGVEVIVMSGVVR